MKSASTLLLALICSMFLLACQPGNQTPDTSTDTPDETDNSQFKKISLIHLNDLHAHLVPHNDFEFKDSQPIIKKNGGLARIAGAIKQLRSDNPNSLLMNIGDTYHGGVEAFYSSGNAIVDPVNALNIDIGVPGNWDFAYGPSVTRLRYTGEGLNPTGQEIKQVNYPSLAANVSSTTRLDFLPATHTFTVDGIKLGFIGISSDIVPRMFAGFAIGFDFLEGEQNYIDLINQHAQQLRMDGVDAVIVMSELGIHKDIALADKINTNSIDVFFSAHTHELTKQPLQSLSGALIVEAGNDTYLGNMDLYFDDNKQLMDQRWTVLVMDETQTEDLQMANLVNATRAAFLNPEVNISFPVPLVSQTLTQPIDTVIANTNLTLSRRQALENTFNSAFAQTLKQIAGTDIAITSGFRYGSVIPAAGYLFEDSSIASGDITIEDAYRFFPVSINLAAGNISGARLKNIIEENLSAVFSSRSFDHSGGWFDGFAGIDLNVDLSQPNNQRINNVQLNNSQQDILDNDELTISGCIRPTELETDNILCGYDGMTNVRPLINPTTNEPWTGIDFLIEQFISGQFSNSSTPHIIDANNTLMWPAVEYVQPLKGAN